MRTLYLLRHAKSSWKDEGLVVELVSNRAFRQDAVVPGDPTWPGTRLQLAHVPRPVSMLWKALVPTAV